MGRVTYFLDADSFVCSPAAGRRTGKVILCLLVASGLKNHSSVTPTTLRPSPRVPVMIIDLNGSLKAEATEEQSCFLSCSCKKAFTMFITPIYRQRSKVKNKVQKSILCILVYISEVVIVNL